MKNVFQTGGSLPDLEFANIRQAIRPRPVEEFGSLVTRLNEDYDTGLASSNELLAQATALETSPFPEDRERGRSLKERALGDIDKIREVGDFENQVSNIKKLAGDFNRSAIPLIQRQQSHQKNIVDRLNDPKSGINANTAEQILNYIKKNETDNPTIRTTEDGIVLNTFDPSKFNGLFAKDVDIVSRLDDLAKGFAPDVTSSLAKLIELKGADKTGTGIPITVAGQTTFVKAEDVEALLDSAIESDPDIQAMLARDKKLDVDNTARLDVLKDAIAEKAGFKRTEFSQQFIPKSSLGANNEGYELDEDGVITVENGQAIGLTTRKGLGDLNDSIEIQTQKVKELQTLPIDNIDRINAETQLENLKRTEERFIEKASEGLNDKDKKLFKRFGKLSQEKRDALKSADLYNTVPFGEFGRVATNKDHLDYIEYTKIKDRIESIVDENLLEELPLTEETFLLSSSNTGKFSTELGEVNNLNLDAILNTGFSVVDRNNIKSDGLDLKTFLQDQYEDELGENLENLEGAEVRVRASTALTKEGWGTKEMVITTKDGERVIVDVSKGKGGLADQITEGRSALINKNSEVRRAGNIIRQNTAKIANSNLRVGEVVEKVNMMNMRTTDRPKILFQYLDDNGESQNAKLWRREDGWEVLAGKYEKVVKKVNSKGELRKYLFEQQGIPEF